MKAEEVVKQLQAELEHRTEVEHQAEQLIVNGEYEKAKELLQTLDDTKVRELKNLDNDKKEKTLEEIDNVIKRTCEIMLQDGAYITADDLKALAELVTARAKLTDIEHKPAYSYSPTIRAEDVFRSKEIMSIAKKQE